MVSVPASTWRSISAYSVLSGASGTDILVPLKIAVIEQLLPINELYLASVISITLFIIITPIERLQDS